MNMNDIAVVVSVAGAERYFEFASYSIPSFLRNNPTTALFVFTDNADKIRRISEEPEIVDLEECLAKYPDMVKRLKARGCSDIDMEDHTRRYGYLHHHIFISAMLPIAETHLERERYNHILKVDCDSYFAGGDLISLLKEDIKRDGECDLYLVARKHRLMQLYGGSPGVGFTLWRKGGDFIPAYVENFHRSEQVTILDLLKATRVRSKILSRPGYHFVRPFWQAKNKGWIFTKEMASQFLPAYFHLYGVHALKNLKKLEEWFGDA